MDYAGAPIEATLQIRAKADNHNSALKRVIEIFEPLAKVE
jgi:hypothetical protein